jgi:Ni,Fe-hydrogenase III component G
MTVAPTQEGIELTGFVGEVIKRLGRLVVEVHQCDARRGIIRIDPETTVEVAKQLFAMTGSRLATATGIDVRDGIDILYHWAFEPAGAVLTVKALAARPEMAIESIAPVVVGATWIEREMHDLLGANFCNHPDMRRLILDDSWPQGVYPLRRDFDQVLDRPPLPSHPPMAPGAEEGGKS